MPRQVAVWIDHKEARIFHITDTSVEATVKAPLHNIHNKHPDKQHPDDQKHFFHDVVAALAEADQILIVGPSTAKLGLVRYVHKHSHLLDPKIVGIETVDHPTDGQLVAYARKYFAPAP